MKRTIIVLLVLLPVLWALVGSLLARANGLIGETALLAINCVNGLVPFALGLAAGGASVARRTAPAARG